METQTNLTRLFINPEFEQSIEENNIIILQNKKNNALIRIAKSEYKLLQKFSDCQSITDTFNEAGIQDVEITFDRLILLIEKAKELHLLINNQYLEKHKPKKEVAEPHYSLIVLYLLQALRAFFKLLQINKIKVKSEFIGTFRFYKLFSVDISNTFISRIVGKKLSTFVVLFCLLLIITLIIKSLTGKVENMFNGPSIGGILMSDVTLNKYLSFFIIFGSIILTSFVHEFAHYFVYRKLGGKTNEFGFALMNYFIPVVYVSTNSVYFWKEKWKKILVSSAGVIVDFLFIVLIYSLLVTQSLKSYPNITFVSFLVMICIIFRTIININFLIPGTDGYFIFVDLLNIKNFYVLTYNDTRIIIKAIWHIDLKQFSSVRIIHFVYFILSWASVVVISLLVLLSIIYPLISDFIIRLFI